MTRVVASIAPEAAELLVAAGVPREELTVTRVLGEPWHASALDARHVLIIDAEGLRDDAYLDGIAAAAAAGCPVVVWSTFTRVTAARALAAAERLPVEIVFRQFDPGSTRVRALLRREGTLTAGALLLHGLASRLARLPEPIRAGAVGLFGGAPIPSAVTDFAASPRLARRTVERAFRGVGIPSVKRFLDAVRAARAWAELADGVAPLAVVADHATYRSVRTLSGHFLHLLGGPPRRVATTLPTRAAVARLIAAISGAPPR